MNPNFITKLGGIPYVWLSDQDEAYDYESFDPSIVEIVDSLKERPAKVNGRWPLTKPAEPVSEPVAEPIPLYRKILLD